MLSNLRFQEQGQKRNNLVKKKEQSSIHNTNVELGEFGTKKEELLQEHQRGTKEFDKMGTITGTLTMELAWNKQKKFHACAKNIKTHVKYII